MAEAEVDVQALAWSARGLCNNLITATSLRNTYTSGSPRHLPHSPAVTPKCSRLVGVSSQPPHNTAPHLV
eukprot:m.25078 g.25078  ORF g.25078 m.25078 type:complete len:70 (-) comp8676_c1_seq2:1546-1755(-)